jgi:hypothetical protein
MMGWGRMLLYGLLIGDLKGAGLSLFQVGGGRDSRRRQSEEEGHGERTHLGGHRFHV